MQLTTPRIIIISIIVIVVLYFGLVFAGVLPGGSRNTPQVVSNEPVKQGITLWGVQHNEETWNNLGLGYPIIYKNFDLATYEEDLINAFATGRGPDVFMIHNSWLPKFGDKIATLDGVALTDIEANFPQVVSHDFYAKGKLYALPLYLDTMVLFYNKEMFDNAGILNPPRDWDEFKRIIPRLRVLTEGNGVRRAAAAIGGSERSINRATDIVSVLMLQSGVKISKERLSEVSFTDGGLESFNFYLQFADPDSPLYTWNDGLTNSIDAFAQESTAMMFGYSHHIQVLQEKNPTLRYRIAPLPQQIGVTQSINYANYWGLAVSSRVANKDNAWRFIFALAADPNVEKKYLEIAKRPPALRSLINEQLTNPQGEIFARQALSARSWLQPDNIVADTAISNAIDAVLVGRLSPEAALGEAQGKLNDIVNKRREALEIIY